MRNIDKWKPTKLTRGGTRVNPFGIAPSSLYITLEFFRILDGCKPYLKGRLTDLGCGDVPYYEWYAEEVEEITCVDWQGTYHGKTHVDIFADLNQSLPLDTGSADTVLLTSTIEHIKEPRSLLKEAHRILSDEGRVILTAPFLYGLHEEPYDYARYTAHGIRQLAEEAGFGVVSLTHYGSAPGVFVDISSKILKQIQAAISGVCPRPVAKVIRVLGDAFLRGYQYFLFFVLRQKYVINVMERLKLSSEAPLGYVAVLSHKKTRAV